MFFLNQRKRGNDRRKHFMINLHERMLPAPAGTEPATSWSPVRRTSNWATEAGLIRLRGFASLIKICSVWINIIIMIILLIMIIQIIQLTLVISTSVISNNRLSRSENLVLVLTQRSTNRQQNIVQKRRNCSLGTISPLLHNIFNISLI